MSKKIPCSSRFRHKAFLKKSWPSPWEASGIWWTFSYKIWSKSTTTTTWLAPLTAFKHDVRSLSIAWAMRTWISSYSHYPLQTIDLSESASLIVRLTRETYSRLPTTMIAVVAVRSIRLRRIIIELCLNNKKTDYLMSATKNDHLPRLWDPLSTRRDRAPTNLFSFRTTLLSTIEARKLSPSRSPRRLRMVLWSLRWLLSKAARPSS